MLNHILRPNNFIFRRLLRSNGLLQSTRASNSAAYEGDGKTTVRVLNDEEPNINLVNTYSAKGFRLSNNLFVSGSILLFPTHVYSWNVKQGIDITEESLIIFDLIVPKVKIIVIGYGQLGEPFDASLPMKLKQKVSDSVHVAGAFVPVRHEVAMTGKDVRDIRQHVEMFGDEDILQLGEGQAEREDPRKIHDYRHIRLRDQGKKKFDE